MGRLLLSQWRKLDESHMKSAFVQTHVLKRKRRVLDQIFAAHAPTPLELKRKLDEWSQNRTLFTPQPLQYERVDSDSSTNSLALSSLLMQAATSEEQQIIEGEPQQQAACHRQDCTCRGMLSNGTCSIIGQLLNSNPDLQRPQVESREWRAARVLSHGDSAVYQYLDENACEDLEDLEPNDLEHEAADERANAALLEEQWFRSRTGAAVSRLLRQKIGSSVRQGSVRSPKVLCVDRASPQVCAYTQEGQKLGDRQIIRSL